MPDAPQSKDAKTQLPEDPIVGGPTPDNPIETVEVEATPDPDPQPGEPEVVATKPPVTPRDQKRAEITAKLKAKRNAEKAPEFTGDMSDPTQVVGAIAMKDEPVAPADEPAATPEPAPAPESQQKKRILKVRHQQMEVDENELIRLAQIGAANESYLNEAKEKAEQADRILKTVQRTAPSDPHQGHDSAHNVDEPVAEPEPSRPHQAKERLKTLIEDIQFGNDPDAAAEKLLETIAETAREQSRTVVPQAHIETLARADFEETMGVFDEWKGKNQTLVNDPMAMAVLERLLYDGYREDLRAIGVKEEDIPRDNTQLADLHRVQRVMGKKVRTIPNLLSDTQGKYEEWRTGKKPAPAASQTPAPTTPPHNSAQRAPVRVVVDRRARRDAIPQQPARASAPALAPQPQTQGNSRRAAFERAKAARGQRVVSA